MPDRDIPVPEARTSAAGGSPHPSQEPEPQGLGNRALSRPHPTAVRYIFCSTKCTALIPLGSGRWGTIRTRVGVNAMLHKNTVFHGLLKHVRWPAFDRLVEQHRADAGVRRLPTKSQFLALLYGQLAGASSLREIVAGVRSHAARLYHLGARPVQRSTLADANAHRPAAVFTELFALMVGQANRHLRRALGDTVYLIDSTALKLDRRSAEWAHF